jgi:hemerythrin
MAIQWNSSLETGMKEIDDAHKTLILWINKLSDAMKSGNGQQEVMNILNFLEKYAAQHFSHEEACMDKYKCPVANANRKAHGEFFSYFTQVKSKLEKEKVTTANVLELHNALSDWLRSHILKIDTNLKACVKVTVNGAAQPAVK